jgi:hypothetical protein
MPTDQNHKPSDIDLNTPTPFHLERRVPKNRSTMEYLQTKRKEGDTTENASSSIMKMKGSDKREHTEKATQNSDRLPPKQRSESQPYKPRKADRSSCIPAHHSVMSGPWGQYAAQRCTWRGAHVLSPSNNAIQIDRRKPLNHLSSLFRE